MQNSFGEQEKSARVGVCVSFARVERIVIKCWEFSFHQTVWSEETFQSKKTSSSHTILCYKSIISPNFHLFHSSNLMRLTFHRDCEKLIFDQNSWITHPNRMGFVSLWSISKILSYEVKLVFLVFGWIFIFRAWFLAIHPMTNKFECLRIFKSHQDWESSTWLI